MLQVTSSSVERHFVNYGYGWNTPTPEFVTPFEDGFYAICRGAVLCEWTGNGFETATEEEVRSHDGTNRIVRGDMDNQVVNGWHVRETGTLEPGEHFDVQLGQNVVLSVSNHAKDARSGQWISIDLLRPNQTTETLYNVNGAQRIVGRKEYRSVLGIP